jgi:Amidase
MVPAVAMAQAQKFRRWYRDRILVLFREVDAILAPATPCTAPMMGDRSFVLDGVELPLRPNLGIYTQPISFIACRSWRCRCRCRRSQSVSRSSPRPGARTWLCKLPTRWSKRARWRRRSRRLRRGLLPQGGEQHTAHGMDGACDVDPTTIQ